MIAPLKFGLRFRGFQRHFAQRALHHGGEPRQIGFQNIVGGSAPQRVNGALLANRSGNEYERGFRSVFNGNIQCAQSVELRQGEIRENDVRLDRLQRAYKIGFGLDPVNGDVQTGFGQIPRHEHCVGIAVLYDDQLQFARHGAWASGAAIGSAN